MTQKKEKERRYAADHVFGAAISLKFIAQGLQRAVSPAVVEEDFHKRLKAVYSRMDGLGQELLQLAHDIWEQGNGGDELRETKVGI